MVKLEAERRLLTGMLIIMGLRALTGNYWATTMPCGNAVCSRRVALEAEGFCVETEIKRLSTKEEDWLRTFLTVTGEFCVGFTC